MGYIDTYAAQFPVFGPPYGNGDVWSYFSDRWVDLPKGEIKVECAFFADVESKYIYYYTLLHIF